MDTPGVCICRYTYAITRRCCNKSHSHCSSRKRIRATFYFIANILAFLFNYQWIYQIFIVLFFILVWKSLWIQFFSYNRCKRYPSGRNMEFRSWQFQEPEVSSFFLLNLKFFFQKQHIIKMSKLNMRCIWFHYFNFWNINDSCFFFLTFFYRSM